MTHEQRTQLWIAGIFLVVIVGVTAGAALISGNAAAPSTAQNFTATETSPVTASDHVRGSTTAKVSLIEYGDFECPACGEYEPLVQQLEKTYSDRVQFVFRHFPLYQIHPFAMISAQASEAAGLQGKFWEMHDILYAKQSEWSTNATLSAADVQSKYIDEYAKSLGLDMTKFDSDINSDAVKAKVQSDLTLGTDAKIDHTPTFFINLMQIPNPQSLAEFQADLDAALASSTAAAATSTPAE